MIDIQNRQEISIAQGGLVNSKFHSCFVESSPTHAIEGRGPYLIDYKNEKYIDMICALGPISIGYNNPSINASVMKQVSKGSIFSLPDPLEVEASEYLLENYLTKYDAVKYLLTGAEATSGACRIARSATARQWIYTQGYHGHHANWISTKPNNSGVGDKYNYKEFENIDALLEIPDCDLKIAAAIILEPIHLEHSDSNKQKLISLKQKCLKNGTLVIFDEIVCGFRIPENFISNIVEPDLICIGKGIANGYPLAAIVGKKHLMHQTPYFISSTFAGFTLSLSAHLATMQFIKNNPLKEMYLEACSLMNKIQGNLNEIVDLKGYGTRGYFDGNVEMFALLQQELLKNKVLIGKSYYFNYSHVSIKKIILDAFETACYNIHMGAELKSRLPYFTFKRA